MKNRKGFTLVELLGAITVLGILSSVAIISVSSIINKTRKQYYVSLRHTLEEAGRSYFNDHRILLPVEIDDSAYVTAEKLIDTKYLKEFKDHKKQTCSLQDSSVKVTRVSMEDYKYEVSIFCPLVDSSYYR